MKDMNNKKLWPVVRDADERLRKICFERALTLYSDNLFKEILERIEWELDAISITESAFSVLFIMELMRKNGLKPEDVILDGTSGDSFVLYLCGISSFNPLDYNLCPYFAFGFDKRKPFTIALKVPSDLHKKIVDSANELEGVSRIIRGSMIDGDCRVACPHEVLYIPEGVDLSEITDTVIINGEEYTKTDYRCLLNSLYSQVIQPSDDFYQDLEEEQEGDRRLVDGKYYLENRMIKCFSLIYFMNPYNLELKESRHINFLMTNRDDVYEYLCSCNIPKKEACQLTEKIRKGLYRYEKYLDKDMEMLDHYGVEKWFIDECRGIKYLPPKSYIISKLMAICSRCW